MRNGGREMKYRAAPESIAGRYETRRTPSSGGQLPSALRIENLRRARSKMPHPISDCAGRNEDTALGGSLTVFTLP